MARTKKSSLGTRLQHTIESGKVSTRKPWNKKLDKRSSLVRKLQQREIGERSKLTLGKRANTLEKFRNFLLQGKYLTYNGSEVINIIAAGNIVFAMTESGIVTATSCITNKHICNLNICPDEIIRSIYYNKKNESLITISIGWEQLDVWRCRSTPIEYIRKNQLGRGVQVFDIIPEEWQHVFEFDELHDKVLIYTPNDGILKVYDLNYCFLYPIIAKNLKDIESSDGILMLVFELTSVHLSLRIISSEDGKELASVALWLCNKHVEVIRLFNKKILFKFEDENFIIQDVRRSFSEVSVDVKDFSQGPQLVGLCSNQLFLIFIDGKLEVRNFQGEYVTGFEDHDMMDLEGLNSIVITSDENLIMSCCRACGHDDGKEADRIGSINISNIHSSKCILKLCATDPTLKICPLTRCTIREALTDETCFFYDEDQNVIYTGFLRIGNQRLGRRRGRFAARSKERKIRYTSELEHRGCF